MKKEENRKPEDLSLKFTLPESNINKNHLPIPNLDSSQALTL